MSEHKHKEFNERVFATMPDEPYLGPVTTSWRRRLWGADRRTSWVDWCFRAAVVLLIPLALVGLLRPKSGPSPVEFTAKAADVYTVANGVRSQVVLPDSTVIWLNCGSELLVAQDYMEGNREVSLRGEGFFEVHSDVDNPFYVRTPAGPTVKVTGTVFNLSCYSPEKEVKVTLLEGRVQIVTARNEVYTMQEGTKLTVKGSFSSENTAPNIEGDTAWTKGTLHFEDTPMREVIASLERWYGVNVQVLDNSVYKNSITADFRSESISQVLELLAITCNLNYSIDNRDIVLN